MDLVNSVFASEVINIIRDIADSHFVAFDLELSGIAPHSQQRVSGKPSLQEIYEDSVVAAKKYQILQIGLSIVKEDLENGQYILKPYNFNISPVPTLRERQFTRDWSMNSGAVQFLLKNKFNFGLPFSQGIHYLSRAEEIQARMTLSGENDRKRPDMILKSEDAHLVKHIRESIETWQTQPEETKENYLNIPNDDRRKGVPGVLNRYQIRLTHQIVQNEFPELKTTSMQHFVQITNPTQEERKRQRLYQKEQIDREIGRAVGFRWILEAIAGKEISGMPDEWFLAAIPHFGEARDGLTKFQAFVTDLNQKLRSRRKILVGHNCFTDLINLHQFFLGDLPERVEDFQDSIQELFPAIIDTKHVASFGNARWGDTSLNSVDEDLRHETIPQIVIPSDFDRYNSDAKLHEAGYDAMLTANIAIKLSARMEREGVYHDQDTLKDNVPLPTTSTEPFGAHDQGYVTASEDFDSQSSESSSYKKATSGARIDENPDLLHTTEIQDINSRSSSTDTKSKAAVTSTLAGEPSEVVAVKSAKPEPKPGSWKSTAEINKLHSAFAATNIYDILDKEMDANSDKADTEQDTLLTDDLNSSGARIRSMDVDSGKLDMDEMIKEGKLMPRWDGGHGFWQLFGNKLQVNSCKEGVCIL